MKITSICCFDEDNIHHCSIGLYTIIFNNRIKKHYITYDYNVIYTYNYFNCAYKKYMKILRFGYE